MGAWGCEEGSPHEASQTAPGLHWMGQPRDAAASNPRRRRDDEHTPRSACSASWVPTLPRPWLHGCSRSVEPRRLRRFLRKNRAVPGKTTTRGGSKNGRRPLLRVAARTHPPTLSMSTVMNMQRTFTKATKCSALSFLAPMAGRPSAPRSRRDTQPLTASPLRPRLHPDEDALALAVTEGPQGDDDQVDQGPDPQAAQGHQHENAGPSLPVEL